MAYKLLLLLYCMTRHVEANFHPFICCNVQILVLEKSRPGVRRPWKVYVGIFFSNENWKNKNNIHVVDDKVHGRNSKLVKGADPSQRLCCNFKPSFHRCVSRTHNSAWCLKMYGHQWSQAITAFATKACELVTMSHMLDFARACEACAAIYCDCDL